MRITYTDGDVTVSSEDDAGWTVQMPRKALTDCDLDDLEQISAQLAQIIQIIRLDTRNR